MPHFIQLTHMKLFFDAFGFAWRISAALAIFLIGALIEERNKIDDTPNRKGVQLNIAHAFVYHGASMSLGVMAAFYLKVLIDKIPGYRAPIQFRGGASEVFILTFLAVATQDFLYYWFHRWQHTSKWLWAEHELHHSDEHVNVTTAWRQHWLETVLQPLFLLPPLLLLFNPALGTVISIILFQYLMVYFVHLNSPIRFGWFNRVLTSPQNHRIHHSTMPEHIDKNFATVLPLWDILFGTYYHPKQNEWPSTGVNGVTVTSLGHAIVLPFLSWYKMLRKAERPSPKQSVGEPVASDRA